MRFPGTFIILVELFVRVLIASNILAAKWKRSITSLFRWWAKVAYEALATPLPYAVVGYLKRREQMDVYDPPSALDPLGVFA